MNKCFTFITVKCIYLILAILKIVSLQLKIFVNPFIVTAVGLFQKFLKHNRIYVLNNITQVLQVSKTSNIKINYMQVSIHDKYKRPGH